MIKVSARSIARLEGCSCVVTCGNGVEVNLDSVLLSIFTDNQLGLQFECNTTYPYLGTYTREDLLHRLNDTMLSLCEGFLDKGGY